METTVEQLIKERSYASLTGEELVSVSELCETEEEFQNMKQFFQELEGVAASDKTIINPEVKQSLDAIFGAKFPGIHASWTAPETAEAPVAPVIPLYQRTWVRVAAVGLIVLATAPFWNLLKTSETSQEKALQTAKLETTQANGMQQADQESGAASTDPAFSKQAEAPQLAALHDGDLAGTTYGTYSVDVPSDKAVSINAETLAFGASSPAYAGTTYTWAATAADVQTGTDAYFKTEAATLSFSNEGRLADLNPNGYASGEVSALSLAAQPDDLLDLLSPAF
jgi:hypothetical protein